MEQEKKYVKLTSRIAGILYLGVAITGYFTYFVGKKLIIYGDPTTTASNIMANVWLFRAGIMSDLVMIIFWISFALVLYRIFESVSKSAVLFLVSFVLVGSAIVCVNDLNQYMAFSLLNGESSLDEFGTNQTQSAAMLFFDLSKITAAIANLFFGLWLLPLSYLILRSNNFPKMARLIIGILLIIAGLGYIINFSAFFLFPSANLTFTKFTPIGEVLLLFWLLIKGLGGREQILAK